MANPFSPKLASATTAAPSGSTVTASLAGECPQVRLVWKATSAGNLCNFRWAVGAPGNAVTTDMAIADGATETFTKNQADTLTAIGTGTLYIVCGTGP